MRFEIQALRFTPILLFSLLWGCASPQTRPPAVSSVAAQNEAMAQKRLVVQSRLKARNRLARIGHQVLVAGSEICGEKVQPAYGFLVLSESAFDKEFLEAVRAEGFDRSVQVSYVIPGSNAEHSGLHAGDKLIRIGDWEVPQAKKDSLKDTLEKMRPKDNAPKVLALTVQRDESELTMNVESDLACSYPVLLGKSDDLNAYADGKSIVVEKGMMRFAREDEELALVISHELAHNAMGHISAKKTNVLLGGAVGLLVDIGLAIATAGAYSESGFTRIGMEAGAGSYSVEFEQEADYVGMYILKRAGYNVGDAPDFWRRMAIEHPESIELRKSHPTSPERFVALEATIIEIETKASAGQALLPEMKQ